jgi:dihydropteroate synthase
MLRCGAFQLPLTRPLVMGIVNLTPDSFSGDGLASNTSEAVARARQQIDAGADLLDIGAESSRPGAAPTSEDEELRRLLPVLEALGDCTLDDQ